MKRKLYLASRSSEAFPKTFLMTADLETKKVRTCCDDTEIDIEQFLEFADFIRAKMHTDADGHWENVGELFEREEEE